MPDPPSFDRYTIEQPLGEGGMGVVYRARDDRLGRRVALKVLRLDAGATPEARTLASARLVREARAAAALDHPNAVSIFDVGEHDGAPFIAMELVAGRSLRAAMGDASVTTQEKLQWLADVARALDAAHRAGIVHRDVKPENVMVRTDGIVKVLDFGIARRSATAVDPTASTQASALHTVTAHGTLIGTPEYMAPEQIKGDPRGSCPGGRAPIRWRSPRASSPTTLRR
jgi:serine/threonine protein kinase